MSIWRKFLGILEQGHKRLSCPHCKRTVDVGSELFGATVSCPYADCGRQFSIPSLYLDRPTPAPPSHELKKKPIAVTSTPASKLPHQAAPLALEGSEEQVLRALALRKAMQTYVQLQLNLRMNPRPDLAEALAESLAFRHKALTILLDHLHRERRASWFIENAHPDRQYEIFCNIENQLRAGRRDDEVVVPDSISSASDSQRTVTPTTARVRPSTSPPQGPACMAQEAGCIAVATWRHSSGKLLCCDEHKEVMDVMLRLNRIDGSWQRL